MPRSQWSGSISFGLVNIPVKLYRAVTPKTVRFHLLHDTDRGRIRQKRICTLDGAEVPPEHLVRGYEIDADRYVTLSDEELERLDPVAAHTIDIEEFVRAGEIDPAYFDQNYLLAPDPAAKRPYALLVAAMHTAGRVALGRIVMRTKQYLAALRPKGAVLMLATLFYADEIVPGATLPNVPTPDLVPNERELAMAGQLIESLASDFTPEKYQDEYRERVHRLIEEKAGGAAPAGPPPVTEQPKVVNLMDALEASIARTRRRAAPAHAGKRRKA